MGRRVLQQRADGGAAAVELAIVLPVLILLVCGIIDFGRMLDVQITLSAAAREGARWEALRATNTTLTQTTASRVTQAAVGVSPAPATTVVSGCSPSSAATDNAQVTAASAYSMLTPISAFAALFGGTFPATITLTGQGVMRCGG